MMKRAMLCMIGLIAMLAVAGTAHGYPDNWGDGTYMPIGAAIGADTANGGFTGGEVSIISFRKVQGVTLQSVMGVYGDFIVSGGARRISAGPEYGIFPVIFDCGYLQVREDGEIGHGFVVRASLCLFALPYVRYGRVFGEGMKDNFIEMGVLLKIPLPLP